MSAEIINGKLIAQEVRSVLKTRAESLIERGVRPGLAVIIVGEDPASNIYVNNKVKACRKVCIHSEVYRFPSSVDQDEVLACVQGLNANPRIHGILVQLPLPAHFDSNKVTTSIAIEKDVDSFHLYNVGALVTGNAALLPCTPYGILVMLDKHGIQIEGQQAVIVGRSNIVGKPISLMLLEKGATVTICTSKTKDLAVHTTNADILVVATGRPGLITADMVKTGATIIDVGINRLPNGKLAGDVNFESVNGKAGYITPVPGGVGPMTTTMLLNNTIEATERTRADT